MSVSLFSLPWLVSRRRDGTYVLRLEDSLNVKRIAIEPQGRKISVASDNPFHASWNNRKRRAVHIVGRVLWFGCKMQ